MVEVQISPIQLAVGVDTLTAVQPQQTTGADNPLLKIPQASFNEAYQEQIAAEKIYKPDLKRVRKEGTPLPLLTKADYTGVDLEVNRVIKVRQAHEAGRGDVDRWRPRADELDRDSQLFSLVDFNMPQPADALARQALVDEQQLLGLSDDDLREIRLYQHDVDAWDQATPREMTSKQVHEDERLNVAKEKIKQNEILQRENLGELLLNNRAVLEARTSEKWSGKVAALKEMQHGYDVVDALSEQTLRLNDQQAQLWGTVEDDTYKWQSLTEKDAKKAVERRLKHPINMDRVETLKIPGEELTPLKIQERSDLIKRRGDLLIRELNGLRGPGNELNVVELVQLKRRLGIVEGKDATGNPLYSMESGSVMQSLLIAEAFEADAADALKENLDAIAQGDFDCVETAVEAANMKVRGESMTVMAHAMVLETLNQEKAQEAIRVAQELGLVEKTKRLETMVSNSREVVEKCGKTIGVLSRKFLEAFKNPALWKKLLKYLGYAALGVVVSAGVATGVAMSGLTGGSR
jgi:hypothetical protein